MASVKLSTVESIVQGSNIAQGEKDQIIASAKDAAALPDTGVYRIVVLALGLALFIPLIALLMKDKDSAQLLLPLATTALGALAGLLAPSPAGGG